VSAGPPLYLVRHGEAAAYPDSRGERPLTAAGADAVRRLAAWCAQNGVAPHAIRHSGLLRARETAEILAAALAPSGGVAQRRGISPDDDAASMAAELRAEIAPVMLVTHLPFVGELASHLVAGQGGRGVAWFAPGSIACLERTASGFRLAASWTP
jgi:phosphohistidine phosphatase